MVNTHAYTDGIHGKHVLLIGQLPPPYGGVSVHVERTKYKLEQQANRVTQFDPCLIYSRAWMAWHVLKYGAHGWYLIRFISLLLYSQPDIVIYHVSYDRQLLAELWVLRTLKYVMKYKIIFVDHDCRHMERRPCRWITLYTRLLRSVDHLVLIGSVTAQSYSKRQVNSALYITIESAFLPPDICQRDQVMKQYPQSLLHFLHTHSPSISMNAYQWALWKDQDLYGFDLALESIRMLRADYPTIGLVILVSTIGDYAHYEKIIRNIDESELSSHIYVLQGNYQLWPLFFHTDLFIRPTRSDGASVSVQEALFCNIPVVATDVCWRPAGVITCAADSGDLCRAISALLSNMRGGIHVDVWHNHLHPKSS